MLWYPHSWFSPRYGGSSRRPCWARDGAMSASRFRYSISFNNLSVPLRPLIMMSFSFRARFTRFPIKTMPSFILITFYVAPTTYQVEVYAAATDSTVLVLLLLCWLLVVELVLASRYNCSLIMIHKAIHPVRYGAHLANLFISTYMVLRFHDW